VLAIVTYSITFNFALSLVPPAIIPLVLLERPVPLYLPSVKSPKSVTLPAVEIVTYSI